MARGAKVPPEHVAKRGFHGTNYDYTGAVRPNAEHGNAQYPTMSEPSTTYFLPALGRRNDANELAAWKWSKPSVFGSDDRVPDRRRVHFTEPEPEQHIDANLHGYGQPHDFRDDLARVTPSQRILDTIWGPPPNPRENQTHVEMTLPHVNWQQFGAWNYLVHKFSGEAEDDRGNTVRESDFMRNAGEGFKEITARIEARRQVPGQLGIREHAAEVGARGWNRIGVGGGTTPRQEPRTFVSQGGDTYELPSGRIRL